MSNSYKLSDNVSMRLIQIFQEAIMTGVDGADLLRQVRLQQSESDSEVLVLTPDYQQLVKDSYEKLEARAKELQESLQQTQSNLIFSDGNN